MLEKKRPFATIGHVTITIKPLAGAKLFQGMEKACFKLARTQIFRPVLYKGDSLYTCEIRIFCVEMESSDA